LASSKRRPIKILPGFDSAAAREFLLGKVRKREPRQSFPSYEKRFQRALVLDGGALQRPHCWVKLEVAGLVLNFEGALAVGPLTLGGIRVAGAPLVAALPPPLPHRSLAEVAELNALLWERFQALRSGAEERR
jgi:hypothetical protein